MTPADANALVANVARVLCGGARAGDGRLPIALAVAWTESGAAAWDACTIDVGMRDVLWAIGHPIYEPVAGRAPHADPDATYCVPPSGGRRGPGCVLACPRCCAAIRARVPTVTTAELVAASGRR